MEKFDVDTFIHNQTFFVFCFFVVVFLTIFEFGWLYLTVIKGNKCRKWKNGLIVSHNKEEI